MSPVTVLYNRALDDDATNDSTSTVGEPSLAVSGAQVFVTGNWYASASKNGGADWTFVDPYTTVPSAAGGFCCDQVTLHDHARGIWIWILQYVQQGGANVFRIAVTRDADFPSGWYWWDIAPTTVDQTWTGVWFDYPDAQLTAEHLFVSFNLYDEQGSWKRAALMRFPLQTLAAGGTLNFHSWSTTDIGSLRLVSGARDTMYAASHSTQSRLRLVAWPDAGTSLDFWDIDVTPWNGTISSTAPNGVDWLGRTDGRVTGGCLAGGTLCFMWTAGADADHPHPHCRAVRIAEAEKTVTDEPHIWSADRAWAYPSVAPNDAGVIGFTAFHGGEDRVPGHMVGVRDDAAGAWVSTYARLGTHAPAEPKWGDYLTCRTDAQHGGTWVAAGYTLEGGGSRSEIVPRIARFAAAAPAAPEWAVLGGKFASPPVVATTGPERTDVFALDDGGTLWHKMWDGTAWQPDGDEWEQLGGPFTAPPVVTSAGADKIDVFALGGDGAVRHLSWDGTGWRGGGV